MGTAVDLRAEIDDGRTPTGYHRLHVSLLLKRTDFEQLAHELLSLRAHEAAGLDVRASDIPVITGSDVRLRLGIGSLAVTAPCSVLEVIDEPTRRGFTYGTLPGHPESGSERFLLEHDRDGRVRFTITALSKPATRLARASGPLGRVVQRHLTSRYLHALDRL